MTKAHRLQALFWIILGVALFALWYRYMGRAPERTLPGDFSVYHQAWQRVQAGTDPYRLDEYSAFKYSPAFLAFMGLFPLDRVLAWQWFGSLLVLALGFTVVWGVGANERNPWRLALGWALAWKGALEVFDYGQTEPFLMALTVGAAALLGRSPVAAGFLVGLLPAFKLPWLFFAPVFLVHALFTRRKTKPLVLGGLLGTVMWAVVVPALTFGVTRASSLTASWVYLVQNQPGGLFGVDINQGIWVQAARWWGAGPGATGFSLVVIGVLLALLLSRLGKARATPLTWLPGWWLLGQLVNPLSWRWGSLFALGIPLNGRPFHPAVALSVVVLWLLQLNSVVQLLGFSHWTDLHSYGVITLYWIFLLLI